MKENINAIFIWLIRVGLIVAAIYCSLRPEFPNQKEIVSGLVTGAVCSFLFLDPNE